MTCALKPVQVQVEKSGRARVHALFTNASSQALSYDYHHDYHPSCFRSTLASYSSSAIPQTNGSTSDDSSWPGQTAAEGRCRPVRTRCQVEHNVKKATEICSRIEPSSVDLVCLPEMIFTGYVFPNANAISPYLEDPQSGPTSQFCKSLASKLGCYVIAGYPEILKADERGTREDGSLMVGGNSAIIAGPTGETFGYRKTNMFETDKTWAKPGEGFKTFTLPNLPPGLQDLSLAICMDLNPHPPTVWTLEGGPYELADYCRSSAGKPRTKVLVLLNAWLDSQPDPESKWDTQVLNYWAARLRPLWDVEHSSNESPSDIDDEVARETIVIICNRCGSDGDVLFAGTSCIMKLHEGTGEPDVLGVMGRQEEGLRVWAL